MGKLKEREHDFSSKLRQHATFQRLREYVQWQRKYGMGSSNLELPIFSPISINLDLTSSCNFSCPFCVDSKLINSGKSLTVEEVKKTIDTLNDLPNVLWLVSEEAPSKSLWWNDHLISLIRAYEKDKRYQHPIGYAAPDSVADAVIYNSDADWVAPQVRSFCRYSRCRR